MMKKETCLKEFRKRLPSDIIIEDETTIELTDDEFVSILSWIKYFNEHYAMHGIEKDPYVIWPIISKRLRLDFGLYRFPRETGANIGKHVIYITQNGKLLNGTIRKLITVKELINTWRL